MSTDLLFPEVSGPVEERPPIELLAELARRRFTGLLEAHDGPRRWELTYRGGDVAAAESTEPGDPAETVAALTHGRYRLTQQLLLPGGEVSHRRVAEGALEDHPPALLFRTCEAGGLSGALRLLSRGRCAEVLFEAGDPLAITLDGHQDVEVQDLFRWREGHWAMLARPAFDPGPKPEDTGVAFLRVVEVALSEVLSSAARGQPEERVEPVRPARSEDSSVRVVYLDTVQPLEDSASKPSRYARKDLTAVQVFVSSTRREGPKAKEDEVTAKNQPVDDGSEASPDAPEVPEPDEPEAPVDDEQAEDDDQQAEDDDQRAERGEGSREPSRSEPASEPPKPVAWPDRFWVWVLAGLALAALIALLHATSPGAR